ncbi:MAG TPA: 16S rRNA (cytidine(1402)-2'-O)-methyltransferase [Acidimicrobiales bacterium]|nr:16S rRNA (cytidine(1402)-2'-O)-methyltransferase [Acidimicrobiales bacterium]
MATTDAPRGVLVLVGTPIGNLDDLTPRAAAALATADVIACEDTRRTGRLLAHLGIAAPKLLVANDHTEAEVAPDVVERIAAGQKVAVVTDAGMPGISDPGELLVRATLDAGFTVEVVPGPSALDTALVLSGLPAGRFCFEGFLPRKGSARRARLETIALEQRTVLLYEAPHRVHRTVGDLRDVCGDDRQIAILRELTKLHEEHWRGSLADADAMLDDRSPRGEYVLVVAGAEPPVSADDATLLAALEAERAAGRSTRDAVAEVAQRFGEPHRRVYDLAILD